VTPVAPELLLAGRLDLRQNRSSSIDDYYSMPSPAPSAKTVLASSPTDTANALAAMAKALGHPARIQIVRLLLEKQSCIGCDIVDEVGRAQSTVSEHLRILKAAGIITGEIERPRVCYSLNPDSLRPLALLLNGVLATVRLDDTTDSTQEHR
jgi:ArsR family transcriptional regulator, arsenate/arsenite/antimonite-responsive transcriptional repressor